MKLPTLILSVFSISCSALLCNLASAEECHVPETPGIVIDTFTLKCRERQVIANDLAWLKSLKKFDPPQEVRAEFEKVFGFKQIDGETLLGWLNERIHYIFGYVSPIYQVGKYARLKNHFDFPLVWGWSTEIQRAEYQSPSFDIADNIGTQAFQDVKAFGQLLHFLRPGLPSIPVTSPRIGVIRISEGYFLPRNSPNFDSIEATSNRIFRLSFLFHEARHSDGHGLHAGFPHIECLVRSIGFKAMCDAVRNGPYKVGALAIQILKPHCLSCTVDEHEHLQISLEEALGRVPDKLVVIPDVIAGLKDQWHLHFRNRESETPTEKTNLNVFNRESFKVELTKEFLKHIERMIELFSVERETQYVDAAPEPIDNILEEYELSTDEALNDNSKVR